MIRKDMTYENTYRDDTIVWKNHKKMEISILHICKSNLGPSNLDGSNTMDGSNLFEGPANFPYIFKLNKIFRSNSRT
jgi:hypothetical protein